MADNTRTGQRNGRVDVVHNTTWQIDAPLTEVFPAVLDFPRWQGYDSVEHVSGPVGSEGELMRIKKPEGEVVWQEKFCKLIRLDPPRQIIWRVYTESDQVGEGGWEHPWGAVIDYRLEADGPDATTIHLQVVKEYFVPYEDESELAAVQALEYQRQTEAEEHVLPRLLEILGR